MTQADPSEPEADDFVADTATDPPNLDVDDTGTTAQQWQLGKPDVDPAVGAEACANDSALSDAAQTDHAVGRAMPARPDERADIGRPNTSKAETGRGAGTPAGLLEEFYSPPEHFNSDSAEQRDSLMKFAEVPRMHTSAQQAAKDPQAAAASQQHSVSDAAERSQEAAALQQQADTQNAANPMKEVVEEAQQSDPGLDCHKDGAEQHSAAQPAKTPMPTKTPANPKRRKGSKRCKLLKL